MIKILGTVLVLFACIALSRNKISDYKLKAKVLTSIISSLKEMSDNISFYKKPLHEILHSLKERTDDVFFKKVVFHLKKDEKETIPGAWEKALNDDIALLPEAKPSLSLLGKNLGTQTAELETENISFCLLELEKILKSSEETLKKNTKMLRSFGILAGIMIVILFI